MYVQSNEKFLYTDKILAAQTPKEKKRIFEPRYKRDTNHPRYKRESFDQEAHNRMSQIIMVSCSSWTQVVSIDYIMRSDCLWLDKASEKNAEICENVHKFVNLKL